MKESTGSTPTLLSLLQGFENRHYPDLARAITLSESQKVEHQQLATQLRSELKKKKTPDSKPTPRLGISGPPGVGKSTFIEALGLTYIKQQKTVAVFCVDPSSDHSGGSILGDKTRMEELSKSPLAFIRPSPSRSVPGGVTKRARESLELIEYFGFDVILIETVGVGQTESAVAPLCDCFLMLLQPGAGDDVQGIKRGILEYVDIIALTKIDQLDAAMVAQGQHHYEKSLEILRHGQSWIPPVLKISSLTGQGFTELRETIVRFFQTQNPFQRRQKYAGVLLQQLVQEKLWSDFRKIYSAEEWLKIQKALTEGKISLDEAYQKVFPTE